MDNDRKPLVRLLINVIIGLIIFLGLIVLFVLSFIKPELFGTALPFIRIGGSILLIV